MVIITIQSSFSGIPLPDLGITFTDKIAHFVLYGILGWLLARGFSLGNTKNPAVWAIIIGCIFAISDELHQAYVPGRDGDVLDLLADFLGIMVFVFIYKWYIRKFRKVTT